MIEQTQQAILDRAQSFLGSAILNYEALPAGIDLDQQLKARSKRLPGLFVAFLGGPAEQEGAARIDGQFAVFLLTESQSERVRRSAAIPLLEVLVPALHAYTVQGVGTLFLTEVSNLFSEQLDQVGITLYSATFKIPIGFSMPVDAAAHLAPFDVFHADYPPAGTEADSIPLPDGEYPADTLTLPGDDS